MADFIDCLTFNRQILPLYSRHPLPLVMERQTQNITERRWGGTEEGDTAIPQELLQALPFVYWSRSGTH